MFHPLCLLICILYSKNSVGTSISLGGIFDNDKDLERAFNYTIDKINKQSLYDATFTATTENVERNSAYESSLAACSLIHAGAVGVFGPSTRRNIDGAQVTCDFKAIPHILIKWTRMPPNGTVINMHPHPLVLARAYMDIIEAWGWTKFIVLYENDESFIRISDLIDLANNRNIYVVVKQLYQIQDDVHRNQLKEIRNSEIYNVVIDCSYEYLSEVLKQAQQVGIVTGKYNFLITNLDLHILDLTNYSFSSVNITGVRIVNPESVSGTDSASDLTHKFPWILRSDLALLMDGVEMYASVLNKIKLKTYELKQPLDCESDNSWKDGYSMLNFMKTAVYDGITGRVTFDHNGLRTAFQLEVIEIMEDGVIQVATWNSSATPSLKITDSRAKPMIDDAESLKNKTFYVTICLTEPYAMLKESSEQLEGNDQFEGYAIDLIEALAEKEGFKYIFRRRPDKDNGGRGENDTWTGMIGDIVYGRAELAIADLTITSERQEAVDFTEPFMNLGITILFEKPKKEPPSFFSFAAPFSFDTWLALLVSVFTVSFSLYVLARLSPDEWVNPYPCIEEPEFLINEFHLKNSFWFTIGSLMQQGTELEPKGTTVRMVGGFWWFFVLIIVASYTANLAAFLTTENPNELFTSLEGLVENAERYGISYGCKSGGATYKFFKGAQNPLYKKVYEYMSEHPEYLAPSNEEGVEWAKKGKYAFFMETTSIDYTIQRHCEVDKVGHPFDANKGYGIALMKNSPYRKRLTLAILQLQSDGFLDSLKKKWWEERRGGGKCSAENVESSDAQPLYLMHVEGVFYVTIFGTILSLFMSLIEWFIGVIILRRKRRLSFKEAFMSELRSFLTFEGNKPDTSESLSRTESKSKSRIFSTSVESLHPDLIGFNEAVLFKNSK